MSYSKYSLEIQPRVHSPQDLWPLVCHRVELWDNVFSYSINHEIQIDLTRNSSYTNSQ